MRRTVAACEALGWPHVRASCAQEGTQLAKRSKKETEAIKEFVRSRAGERCECTNDGCAHHTGRCGMQLRALWDVHKKNPDGVFNALNLEALCVRCHRNARKRDEAAAAKTTKKKSRSKKKSKSKKKSTKKKSGKKKTKKKSKKKAAKKKAKRKAKKKG